MARKAGNLHVPRQPRRRLLDELAGPPGQLVDVLGQRGLARPPFSQQQDGVAGAGEARTLVQHLRDCRGGPEQQPGLPVHMFPRETGYGERSGAEYTGQQARRKSRSDGSEQLLKR